jgi:hypothetical protein
MSEGEQRTFSRSELELLAFAVREGRATPDDARALLTLFCQCVEHRLITARNQVADGLLEYVREAFRAYLNGERVGNRDSADKRGVAVVKVKSIEVAFGLRRRVGRPFADEQKRMEIAARVLRHRLTGMSHQRALSETGGAFHCDESIVSEAWRDHRVSAAVLLSLERQGGPPMTDIEARRLRKALGKRE